MKKYLLSLPLAGGLLFLGGNSFATTTQMSIPSISDLVGSALDTAGAFLTGFWPILGLLMGLAIFGWIVNKLGH